MKVWGIGRGMRWFLIGLGVFMSVGIVMAPLALEDFHREQIRTGSRIDPIDIAAYAKVSRDHECYSELRMAKKTLEVSLKMRRRDEAMTGKPGTPDTAEVRRDVVRDLGPKCLKSLEEWAPGSVNASQTVR